MNFVTSEAELKMIRDEMKPFKLSLTELVSQTRNATGAMTKAVTGSNRKGKNKASTSGSAAPDTTKEWPSTAIFEVSADRGLPVQSIPLSDLAEPFTDLNEPYLITAAEMPAKVSESVEKFAEKFYKSELRNKPEGRAELPLKKEEVTEFKKAAETILHSDHVLPTTNLPKEVAPAAFGIKAGSEMCSYERGRTAALRWQLKGTREVIVVSTEALKVFMKDKKISINPKPDDIRKFFSTATGAVVTKLADEKKIHYSTVGPNEILLVPFDSIWFERAKAGDDVCGVRMAFFLKTDADEVKKINRWLISCEMPSAILSSACEQYASLD